MNLQEAKRQFKKHWKYAQKLKEGGKAWEREMALCESYLAIGKAELDAENKRRYCGE